MAWFRAASAMARLSVRRSLAQLPSGAGGGASAARRFHSTPALRRATTAPRAIPLSRLADSFLDGTSCAYLEELQRAWEADPTSVDESWDVFFRNYLGGGAAPAAVSGQTIHDSMRLLLLIRAYQENGHLKANTNPLGNDGRRRAAAELDPSHYGFTEADLDREFFVGVWRSAGFLTENRPVQTLRSVLRRLEETYCGTTGYQYSHITDRDKLNWLRERIETAAPPDYSPERRLSILDRLSWSTLFGNFLQTKWASAKRFGIEGCEVLVPAVKEAIDHAADLGVESVVIGTAHRGRVDVLANVVRMPLRQLFKEFSGGGAPPAGVGYVGTGDVKHHLGYSHDRVTRSGKKVHLSVVANPSHLESVNPVVEGKTRAKQYFSGDAERKRNMPLLLHGDGSFSAQGVVYESMHFSDLPNFTTGGTVHILNDNQVAFTTDPTDGRSSRYCTDIAKALDAPVFHVNGDDMEAVVRACELAVEWRQTFHSDVLVNIIAYRRFGHNGLDEPFFTQPTMYQVIRNNPSSLEIYQKKLLESGQISQKDIDKIQKHINSILQEEFEKSKEYTPKKIDWLSANWAGLKSPEEISHLQSTGVAPDVLKHIGRALTTLPENFIAHKAVKRIYDQRAQMIETGEGIDWAFAETLAFATLISEGNHVRLSGQDVERGTFSHRHAVLHDQETGREYRPLDNVIKNQPEEMFCITNSSLSEYGVLGYELGYSLENPNSLILWEAQFGDFANGAQVIIDNFLSGGEAKWLRQTGLTLLLPHGYDGQGPEHSSARLERFLQMSNDNPYIIPEMDPKNRKQIQDCNWQVVNVTTPANYFHVLRRQTHRDFRKPLIVMSPKNLIRHKECKSYLSEFDHDAQGSYFKRLIEDKNNHKDVEDGINRLILCSGKVYYELDEERKKMNRSDIAICRVEQICPFPYDLVQRELRRYPRAEIVWCQEEPMNMGAYFYINPRLYTAMRSIGRGNIDDIKYVGRAPSAATATGFPSSHAQEQSELIKTAMQIDPVNYPF